MSAADPDPVTHTATHEHTQASVPAAARVIEAALARERSQRARWYLPALGLAAVATLAWVGGGGMRHDLLELPWWMLAAQAIALVLALVVVPSVGLGITRPSPAARAGLAVAAAVVIVGATVALHDTAMLKATSFPWTRSCITGEIVGALAPIALLVFSGALTEPRSIVRTAWLALAVFTLATVAMAMLCPVMYPLHVVTSHYVPGAAAAALVVAIAAVLRARATSERA